MAYGFFSSSLHPGNALLNKNIKEHVSRAGGGEEIGLPHTLVDQSAVY